MNCECIYYRKGATMEDLLKLAAFVKKTGAIMERYPCAISVMDEKTLVCEDYDGWGNATTIPSGSMVLFVGGKYAYQVPIHLYDDSGDRRKCRIFKSWYPINRDIKFHDIKTDFEEC